MMRIDVVFGTRPELIKLFPVIRAFREQGKHELRIVNTGQHREMLASLLSWFDITPDVDLGLMNLGGGLEGLTAGALTELKTIFNKDKPDWVIVQGDTTTAFAAALAAFYSKIKICHVEAGLRTYNKFSPWPEEINRSFITRLADIHAAPTKHSYDCLIREDVNPDAAPITGNTVIDALFYSVNKINERQLYPPILRPFFEGEFKDKRIVLITGHRRESFGEGFESICMAILDLAEKFSDVYFVYPVHLNPNVQEPVLRILGKVSNQNVVLTPPLPYPEFVSVMQRSYFILTDSGGVQEEAPSLGKPVLIMRENTERSEGIEAGNARLVGTQQEEIVFWVSKLLTDKEEHVKMSKAVNPYGDGQAAARILQAIENHG